MLQDETCPSCGHPIWLCDSMSQNVVFKVRTRVCQAERALKVAENNQKSKNDKVTDKKAKAEWGRISYTIPVVPDGIDAKLPTRDDYYREKVNG